MNRGIHSNAPWRSLIVSPDDNLKGAKVLGLDVPFHLQQLTDEVIE